MGDKSSPRTEKKLGEKPGRRMNTLFRQEEKAKE